MNGFCTSKSEFDINVAGGSKIKAKGEWMVSLKKRNGDYQAVIGLALDRVTVDFPRIDVSGAVQEIKKNAAANKDVQSSLVPLVAGGAVDVLLGIHYSSLFPKLIHVSPCGLGIYSLELESVNACIAGPSEKLSALSVHAGGESSY